MSRLDARTLSLTPGQRVELFDVDLSIADGPVLRFTANREEMIPEETLRLRDTSADHVGGARIPVEPLVPGALVTFELFLTAADAGRSVGLTFYTPGEYSEGNSRNRATINPTTLQVNKSQGSTAPLSNYEVSAYAAGEFTYVRGSGTVNPGLTALMLALNPSISDTDTQPALDPAGTSSVRVMGLRVWQSEEDGDGLNLPVLLPDPDDWELFNAVREYVANDRVALRVPVWRGHAYTPIPVEASGFEKRGNGSFPTPRLTLSNLANTGGILTQAYGDIRGATVTRWRLYADFLDNGVDPDPMAHYAPDIFSLVRRSSQNSETVEFELSSALDQQGVSLPRRQILRDLCPWKYRRWDAVANAFDYTGVDCPYTGTAYFNENGAPVANPENDKCSHMMKTGCRKRYGRGEETPFGGFPMVGRSQM